MSDQRTAGAKFSVEAEQVVLGSMMVTDKVIVEVERLIGDGSAFYRPVHATIYRAILRLRDRQQPTDPIPVAAELAAAGELDRVGGAPYLHTCYAAVPMAANGGYYAGIVAGYGALRELSATAARISQLAAGSGHDDAAAVLEQARELLAKVDAGPARDSLRLWGDTIPDVFDEIEKASSGEDGWGGVPTDLHDLDDLLAGGLRPGTLTLVAARPGVGKSVFLIDLARAAALRRKLRTALFSLEMSEVEIGLRIASAGTGVPLHALRTGKLLTDEDWTKLARFAGDTSDAPLHIDPTATATVAHIRAGAKRLIAQYGGLDLILVDYLQLMEAPGRESREQQVAATGRGLKLLGKELGVPVVAASQLNRNSEHRADKRPTLADLRESGALEQDADVVVLLHREDVHDHESPRAGECDVIVAKNRQGALDTVTVAAQLHLARFKSMAVI